MAAFVRCTNLKGRVLIQNEFLKRFVTGYTVAALGFWGIALSLDASAPAGIRTFISVLKWLVTVPLVIVATGGIAAYFFINLANETAELPPTLLDASPRLLDTNCVDQKNEVSQTPESIKKEEPNPNGEREKREAEKHLERSRFHTVKQTRSSQEALEASLDEF
jgi:hypothetical protein